MGEDRGDDMNGSKQRRETKDRGEVVEEETKVNWKEGKEED